MKNIHESHSVRYQIFYSTISDRVKRLSRVVGREDAAEAIMGCIDRYMADGTLPPGGSDTATILVFNLLRMEIDGRLSSVHAVHVSAPPKKWPMPPEKHREPAAVAAVSAPAAAEQDVDSDDAGTKNRSRSDRATAANAAFTSRRCAVRQTGCAAVWPDSKHPRSAPKSFAGHDDFLELV